MSNHFRIFIPTFLNDINLGSRPKMFGAAFKLFFYAEQMFLHDVCGHSPNWRF